MKAWNPWKIKIYLCLVMWANEYDTEWRGYKIKRGQLIRSTRSLQNEISYIINYSSDINRNKTPSLSTVKRVLDDLKMKHFIDFKTVQHGLLITINNFDMLDTTPFAKMVQQIGNKMEHQKTASKDLLKPRGPDWLMKEWGYDD